MKIHFIKKAAFVFDLAYIFYSHFNQEECLADKQRINHVTEQNFNHINSLLSGIPPIPQELRLFFTKNNFERTFFTWHFFHDQKHLFINESYDLSTVQMLLSANKEETIKKLFLYYFENEDMSVLDNQEKRLLTINRLIQKSTYNNALKNSLYAFFIDPEGVLDTLQKQLAEKAKILTKYYKDNQLLLQKLTHGFQYQTVLKSLQYLSNHSFEETQHLYISFTLYNNYLLYSWFEKNKVIVFLGACYEETVNTIIKQNEDPDLLLLGNILSDANRIKMIRFIAKQKEVNVKDIQKQFGFTAANSYYHLNKMQDAGMLLTRNQGRMVLYRINHIYFRRLSNISEEYGYLETTEFI